MAAVFGMVWCYIEKVIPHQPQEIDKT